MTHFFAVLFNLYDPEKSEQTKRYVDQSLSNYFTSKHIIWINRNTSTVMLVFIYIFLLISLRNIKTSILCRFHLVVRNILWISLISLCFHGNSDILMKKIRLNKKEKSNSDRSTTSTKSNHSTSKVYTTFLCCCYQVVCIVKIAVHRFRYRCRSLQLSPSLPPTSPIDYLLHHPHTTSYTTPTLRWFVFLGFLSK